MKIYTKTGDKGSTGLYGGGRVSKSSLRITAYGEVDELNSVIGLVISQTSQGQLKETLSEIQHSLFTVGAQLASPKGDPKIEIITSRQVEALERQIDVISQTLPEMRYFILPGGSLSAAYLHLARTVCRRAERKIVELSETENEGVDSWLLIYMNRLSDFLFMLARLANHLEKVADIPWVPKKV